MILTIPIFTDDAALADLRQRVEALEWRDGRTTAGGSAKQVKRNEQAVTTTPAGRALRTEIMDAIAGHPVIAAAARPHRFAPLMISRTQDGGHYGAHVDNALMGEGRLRTDLSFTLFLGDPDSYDGGELVIHHAGVRHEAKGQAGELVLYPSGAIHEVAPVTRGTRIACVGWIESLVPDAAQREVLFDLENLRATRRARGDGQTAELLTLDKTISNLLRMWSRR